jgi:hypothetical protein
MQQPTRLLLLLLLLAATHLWGHTQLIEEGVAPDTLHVIPVAHDTVLNGVAQGEDTPL